MQTLERLKSEGKCVLHISPRMNTLRDLSGNGNHATPSGGAYSNTLRGRGYTTTSSNLLTVADSAELQITGGVLIVLGEFRRHVAQARIMSKRDIGGTNFEFYLTSSPNFALFDGSTVSQISQEIEGKNMIGVRFSNGNIPNGFVDGQNIGNFSDAVSITVNDADLILSNFYTGIRPNDNVITDYIILNDSTITDEEIHDIYVEYINSRGVLEKPRRNFQHGSAIDVNATGLVAAFDGTLTADGKLADLSGNGYHGTFTGALKKCKIDGLDSIEFDGTANNYVQLDNSIALDTDSAAVYVTFKQKGGGVSSVNTLLGSSVGSNRAYLALNTSTGRLVGETDDNSDAYNFVCASVLGVTHRLALIFNNKTLTAYLDGKECTVVDNEVTGDLWTLDRIGGVFGTSGFEGCETEIEVYNVPHTEAQVKADYAEYAKRLVFQNDLSDVPPTLAAIALGKLNNSEYHLIDTADTAEILEKDGGGTLLSQKMVTQTNLSTTYVHCDRIYGTAVWRFKKYNDSGESYLYFGASVADAPTASNFNGYVLKITSTELVQLVEYTNGTGTILAGSAAATIDITKEYDFALTRDYEGVCTIYYREVGGAWGLLPVTTGTNPITDTTHTSGQYFGNFQNNNSHLYVINGVHEGVLSLAELQSIYK